MTMVRMRVSAISMRQPNGGGSQARECSWSRRSSACAAGTAPGSGGPRSPPPPLSGRSHLLPLRLRSSAAPLAPPSGAAFMSGHGLHHLTDAETVPDARVRRSPDIREAFRAWTPPPIHMDHPDRRLRRDLVCRIPGPRRPVARYRYGRNARRGEHDQRGRGRFHSPPVHHDRGSRGRGLGRHRPASSSSSRRRTSPTCPASLACRSRS